MKKKEALQETLAELEDILFQQIIHLEEGRLGIEEARQLGEPAPAELAQWSEQLDLLEKQNARHKRSAGNAPPETRPFLPHS